MQPSRIEKPGGFSHHPTGALPWLLWREARPIVQVIFFIRFGVGVTVGVTNEGHITATTAVIGIAWTCLTLSIYLANGYSDQAEDVRNGSHRPLAEGRMLPATVLRAAVLLAAAGELALVATREFLPAVCGAFMLVLGWSYSLGRVRLKNTIGGTAIASAGGGLLTYAAGSLATGVGLRGPDAVVLVTLSLWMAVAGASKDLADVPGDRAAGRRTLPVRVGVHRASLIIAVGSMTLGLAGILYAFLWHSVVLPGSVLATGAVFVTTRLVCTRPGSSRDQLRRPYRAFMVTQYAANLAVFVSCAARLAA